MVYFVLINHCQQIDELAAAESNKKSKASGGRKKSLLLTSIATFPMDDMQLLNQELLVQHDAAQPRLERPLPSYDFGDVPEHVVFDLLNSWNFLGVFRYAYDASILMTVIHFPYHLFHLKNSKTLSLFNQKSIFRTFCRKPLHP